MCPFRSGLVPKTPPSLEGVSTLESDPFARFQSQLDLGRNGVRPTPAAETHVIPLGPGNWSAREAMLY